MTSRSRRSTRRWVLPTLGAAIALVLLIATAVFVLPGQPASDATTAAPPAVDAASAAPEVSAVPTGASGKASPQKIGAWFIVCPTAPQGGCYAQQRLLTADGQQTVASWIIEVGTDKRFHASWRTPTQLDHNRGLAVEEGDGRSFDVPFQNCTSNYCEARAVLARDYLDAILRVRTIAVTGTLGANGRSLKMVFDMDGLSAALSQLRQAGF